MDETLMDIASLTRNQPFCAGVILAKGRRLLLTLNADGVPETLKGTAWRVGGVGGGRSPARRFGIVRCGKRGRRPLPRWS